MKEVAVAMGAPAAKSSADSGTCIRKVVISNFKKFEMLTLDFDPDLNIFAGDNEAGKSSVLLAIDLALSASRSKVETVGIESLMRKAAARAFFSGGKKAVELPVIFVEVYLSGGSDAALHGRCNSLHETAFGVRCSCEPSDDYAQEIKQVLAEDGENFPFEFYSIKFATFSGAPYAAHSKPLRHLLIDGAQINADYAQREYTRTLYRAHATPSERGSHENKYRQAKDQFWNQNLTELNEKLQVTFQVRSSSKSNLESDLILAEDGVPLEARGRGRQSMVKTEFALGKSKGSESIEVLLLEEPENHLSHVNMRRLLDSLAKRYRDAGITVDTQSLSHSRRCSEAVCGFISGQLGIPIQTHSDRVAEVREVRSQEEADALWRQPDVVKLFYQEHYKFGCYSQNWGASKGEDHYDEVCVVLNQKTFTLHQRGELATLPARTLNKLYVALSRSRGNVHLMPQSYIEKFKAR